MNETRAIGPKGAKSTGSSPVPTRGEFRVVARNPDQVEWSLARITPDLKTYVIVNVPAPPALA
jgi:hypothetical protein